VVKTDAIVEGVHFLPDDPPDTIARKALRVNLSDLASKGATPAGFVLTLALRAADDAWLTPFARGLRRGCGAVRLARCWAAIRFSTPGPLNDLDHGVRARSSGKRSIGSGANPATGRGDRDDRRRHARSQCPEGRRGCCGALPMTPRQRSF